jgi:5'(3')-deoxyribonucleotidase
MAFAVAYAALWLTYLFFHDKKGQNGLYGWTNKGSRLDWIGLIAGIGLMVAYRLVRQRLRMDRDKRKARGLTIGIDVDGVLANQISGVLPRIQRRHGISLMYEDVSNWRLPIGLTDIAKEIEEAMGDSSYVLAMPIHDGAKAVLDLLYRSHTIRVITARPPDAQKWTQSWIDKNALSIDSLASVNEKGKSVFATDILVDDYLGNVEEYLSSTNGTAVLVDQPWNRERDCLKGYLDRGRVFVISSLCELPDIVKGVHQSVGG